MHNIYLVVHIFMVVYFGVSDVIVLHKMVFDAACSCQAQARRFDKA